MAIVHQIAFESNRKSRIDYDGGDLNSDGGLLLMKEFYHRLLLKPLPQKSFHTTDPIHLRMHKDCGNLLKTIYRITAAYCSG